MNRLILAAIGFCLLFSIGSELAAAAAGDEYWPMWRGPRATGAAVKGNPPITWSETENIKWKVKVPGQSLSTPVVWGDKMLFLTAIPIEKKAPTPNPQTWVTKPFVDSCTSIGMQGTVGTDPSGVQFFYDETTGNPGGSDSGWQASAVYTDSGLNDDWLALIGEN